jgi:hypothetical protein
VGISIDIEGDSGQRPQRGPNPYYWAKQMYRGISNAELEKRKKLNKDMDSSLDKLLNMAIDDDEETKRVYWQWMAKR